MNGVILRILSGTHLGAEIELSPGAWVVGRDDSCDIILTDASIEPRHVVFHVSDEDVLQAESLDGPLLGADGQPLTDEMLVAGEIYRLGGVLFAWGLTSATEDFWAEVEAKLATLSAPRVNALASTETEEAVDSEGDEETSEADAEEGEAGNAGNEGAKTEDAQGDVAKAETQDAASDKQRTAGIVLGVIAVVAIVGALYVQQTNRDLAEKAARANGEWVELSETDARAETPSFWERIGTFFGFSSEKNIDARVRDTQERLRAEGFTNVTASYVEEQWRLTGSVEDDKERGRLVGFARALSENTLIDVTVDSDYTVALESAFNTQGYWPQVTLRKGANNAGANELEVAAYMLSNVIEERAFEDALANVPGVTAGISAKQFTLKRVIRHRDYLEPLFAKLFTAARLRDVNVEYGNGEVRFLTVLTPERRKALEEVLAKVKTESVVPVKIRVVNDTNAAAVAKATKEGATKPVTPVDPMKPRFRVAGVSGGALKFVTLSTGEKVFVGGTLPGGFVLEAITLDRLDLSKNGKRIKYPLRIGK